MRPLLLLTLLAGACSDSSAATPPPVPAERKVELPPLVADEAPEEKAPKPDLWSCWEGRSESGAEYGYCFSSTEQCDQSLAQIRREFGVDANRCTTQPLARCASWDHDLKGSITMCYPTTKICEEARPPVGDDITAVGECEKRNVFGDPAH